ncbi:uncharacterized protein [Ptychodera flava]|uniref:uncharacterized protein n=1 Tax=Ptychodera flava TaxID=63121 RepID=UPI00396A6D88
MRKRRHSTGLAFIVKICILMTVSLTFLLYLTTDKEYGDTKAHDEMLDWEEYFKKVQKMTKPPSPEILEKLKEGMLRLGGDHEKVLYIKFAENSIRKQMENRTKNDHVGSRIGEHSKVIMKEAHVEIQKEKAPKKIMNPIDADRQTTNKNANNTNEKTNQVNSKRKKIVRNNILPRSLEYPKNPLSRNSEGEVENVEEVYEIGANQNRQFLQVNKMTFSSLNRDDQMGNPSGNAGQTFSDNGVTKIIPARKKRISNEDGIKKYGRTQTFQDIGLQSNSKAHRSNVTLRNVSESDEITFVFPFESYDANSSVDLRTDSSQISGGALKLIPEDAGYSDMQISRISEREEVPIIADNIYWSSFVEDHFKTGLSEDEITTWSSRARHLVVTQMRNPDWKTCGRPLNQFIVMKDGSRMCARYRHPHTEFVQGEVYSFYLARLLGITHVPAVFYLWSILRQDNGGSRQKELKKRSGKKGRWLR